MTGLGAGKKAKLPTEPSPVPTPPEPMALEAQRKAEDVRRKLKARQGRRGTILTEGTLGEPLLERQTLLGGKV